MALNPRRGMTPKLSSGFLDDETLHSPEPARIPVQARPAVQPKPMQARPAQVGRAKGNSPARQTKGASPKAPMPGDNRQMIAAMASMGGFPGPDEDDRGSHGPA